MRRLAVQCPGAGRGGRRGAPGKRPPPSAEWEVPSRQVCGKLRASVCEPCNRNSGKHFWRRSCCLKAYEGGRRRRPNVAEGDRCAIWLINSGGQKRAALPFRPSPLPCQPAPPAPPPARRPAAGPAAGPVGPPRQPRVSTREAIRHFLWGPPVYIVADTSHDERGGAERARGGGRGGGVGGEGGD